MKYFKKLEGENIYLSPRNSGDIEIFTKWLNDFQVSDYIGGSANVLTMDEEKKYLEENTNTKVFVIVRKEDDKIIGSCGIEDIEPVNRIGTLGIFIGEQDCRNKGYGTEAIQLVLDFAFNYLNLNNIKLDVAEFNPRAIRCYEKCGFKQIGRRRKAIFMNGKYYDKISMDILAEEFTNSYIQNKNI